MAVGNGGPPLVVRIGRSIQDYLNARRVRSEHAVVRLQPDSAIANSKNVVWPLLLRKRGLSPITRWLDDR